jgi:hypothetical protein
MHFIVRSQSLLVFLYASIMQQVPFVALPPSSQERFTTVMLEIEITQSSDQLPLPTSHRRHMHNGDKANAGRRLGLR